MYLIMNKIKLFNFFAKNYLHTHMSINFQLISNFLNVKNFFLILYFITDMNISAEVDETSAKIGFSQCNTDDIWREQMQKEMQNELMLYPNMKLIIKDAKSNNQKQIEDIKELLSQHIDLLIVAPNEAEELTPIVSETFKKGIPVIVVDRKINTSDYSAYIGADNYIIGRDAGLYAVKLLGGKGNILEIWGLEGSSPAIDRHRGFMEVIKSYPEIQIVYSGSGEWNTNGGQKIMLEALGKVESIDLVFAHNDFMAIGAQKVAQEAKLGKKIFFIGIDGLKGQQGGIQYVVDGKLDATFLYQPGGDKIIQVASQILNKQNFEKETLLQSVLIDNLNAKIMKLQTDQILSMQFKIDKTKNILDIQYKRYQSQQFQLILVISLLALVILFAGLIFRLYRKKLEANIQLEHQKQEISRQNENLKQISEQLETATQAKLRFFTNISHEFRTPLTLIIGPLESMLYSDKYKEKEKITFGMMHRNAHRLLRLINQIMDFRKIENEKMHLRTIPADIVSFVNTIKDSFNELAHEREITYALNTEFDQYEIYFDRDKMDKMLFNLLSNAFKYVDEKGTVTISIYKTEHLYKTELSESVAIEIKNSGVPISSEHLPLIFDRFYQIENVQNSKPGTGIGLALTKNFIELHQGDINIKSDTETGTLFTLYLRTGNAHLKQDEIYTSDNYELVKREIMFQPSIIDSLNMPSEPAPQKMDLDKPLVLIVEDEADVRSYLKNCLLGEYNVIEAENGKIALEILKEAMPDLVVCDVMMPEMDGIAFTNIVKNDLNTSHIPIILLTAMALHEQKIAGLEEGADSYITKPFSEKHLLVRVAKLIENRRRLRKYYHKHYRFYEDEDVKMTQIDRTFLEKVNMHIEKHLADSNFGVEELSIEIAMSRVHLFRKIKQLTDFNPTDLIRSVRLNKAAALLIKSGKSISEVTYETGFSSASYFSKCFKEQFNMTPKEYIAKNRSKNNGVIY